MTGRRRRSLLHVREITLLSLLQCFKSEAERVGERGVGKGRDGERGTGREGR